LWYSLACAEAAALILPPARRVASLGDLLLESGGVIRDCRIAYRTAGRLNADRSNAVLVTPWFQGTSAQLARQVGPGKLVDTSRYFVILVDALGNGVSSSPSNSPTQPGEAFPNFAIRDIVESHYRLVTGTLRLTHLYAVVGISMGGMQVFEWMVDHPEFMSKTVSIVGTPQTQRDDQRRWEAYVQLLQTRSSRERARIALLELKPRTALNEFRTNDVDHIRQAQAIVTHDVARRFNGSLEAAAAAVRTQLLIVGTWQDREVNPRAAFDFGRLSGAQIFELDGRCGHQAPSCERATLWRVVAEFLNR
jgi:homoserine O-acetyltransferase